jgi:NitT/TauT family transport system substrate-binding protein
MGYRFVCVALVMAAFHWPLTTAASEREELPVLRLALLKFGTANWEADVIRHHGLDRKHGFQLEVTPLASKQAAAVALQAGATDMILNDWIWVSHQRNLGRKLTFVPYSRCSGGLFAQTGIKDLTDLRGKKLGIAGGPLNRSWLLLQVLAQKQYGIDLNREVEKVYGAPPLLHRKFIDGELDGIINFWHYLARLEALGKQPLITMESIVDNLGFDADTPMLGFVFNQHWADQHPDMVNALMAASAAAKKILRDREEEWQRLRPQLNAGNELEFRALQQGFRKGIPDERLITEYHSPRAIYHALTPVLHRGVQRPDSTLAQGTFYQPPEPLTLLMQSRR